MALGKGLNALISNNKKIEKDSDNSKNKVWEIPISKIATNPEQPRKSFDEEKLKELSDSIKEHGVLQPILVSEKKDGGYELIAGERRLRASKLAGLVEVPAVVKVLKDQQKVEISLIENIQRENLNPLEEAFAYKRLIDEFNLKQDEVAKRVGKSRPVITNTIRLLELPDEVKSALTKGKISPTQARTLLSLKNEKDQLDALNSMLGRKITVKELEEHTRIKSGKIPKKDPNIVYLENELRSSLGTKIAIDNKKDKGIIKVYYNSKEELKNLIDKMS